MMSQSRCQLRVVKATDLANSHRDLLAFGGGSMLCFALVFLAFASFGDAASPAARCMGMTAAMTNTGFVALPILHSVYGRMALCPVGARRAGEIAPHSGMLPSRG